MTSVRMGRFCGAPSFPDDRQGLDVRPAEEPEAAFRVPGHRQVPPPDHLVHGLGRHLQNARRIIRAQIPLQTTPPPVPNQGIDPGHADHWTYRSEGDT